MRELANPTDAAVRDFPRGQTQALPLAIHAAPRVPGGEQKAAELSLVPLTLAVIGLLLSEWLGKRLNVTPGR